MVIEKHKFENKRINKKKRNTENIKILFLEILLFRIYNFLKQMFKPQNKKHNLDGI